MASSPLKGTGLAPDQHHPPGTLLPVLARPAPAHVSLPEPRVSPACGTLAQSRSAELLRDTGAMGKTTRHAPPGSGAFPDHTHQVMVSFTLTGSMMSCPSSWEPPALSCPRLDTLPWIRAWSRGTGCCQRFGREILDRAWLEAERQRAYHELFMQPPSRGWQCA